MTALASANPEVLSRSNSALRAGSAIGGAAWESIRRQMLLDHCKWDPQIGDVPTLSPFPLLLNCRHWAKLADLAESAARELLAAEQELLERPELHHALGMPAKISRLLTPALANPSPRILRFDFHLTTDGWRISEVNSDVPGGFTESSSFPRLIAAHHPNAQSPGDVGGRWADAIVAGVTDEPVIVLLHATGFLEDLQVIAYLADRLAERGRQPMLAHPRQIRFHDRRAFLQSGDREIPLGAIVRFIQAEWLANRRTCRDWREFFRPCRTPMLNSPAAILTESKRLPLVVAALRGQMPTWRMLLPETKCPREMPWQDPGWVLKTAYCNTGDTVCIAGLLSRWQWWQANAAANLFPRHWVAQRRFTALPIDSPAGPIFPCLGVYTIDGQAAGIYGRYAHRPLIDYEAIDAAVLIEHRTAP